jgi:hypothetical protein
MRMLLTVVRDTPDHSASPARFGFDEHRDVLHAKRFVVVRFVNHETRIGKAT